MKVIFLDIDGVLNCRRTPNPRKFPYIVDPSLIVRLRGLLARTDAKVVLSSTWRYDPAGLFSARYYGVPFIDAIPDLPKEPRRNEIYAWLGNHPEVERFVVIDDEDDGLDELPLFQPSKWEGLSDAIVQGVADYLDARTQQDMRRKRFQRMFQNVVAVLKGHEG
jgi:hypothetical protein